MIDPQLLGEVLLFILSNAPPYPGVLSGYVSQPMPGVHYPPGESPEACYARLLVTHLTSRSAVQRQGAGTDKLYGLFGPWIFFWLLATKQIYFTM